MSNQIRSFTPSELDPEYSGPQRGAIHSVLTKLASDQPAYEAVNRKAREVSQRYGFVVQEAVARILFEEGGHPTLLDEPTDVIAEKITAELEKIHQAAKSRVGSRTLQR